MVQPGLYRDSIIKLGLAGDTKKYVRKYARKTPSGNIPSQTPPSNLDVSPGGCGAAADRLLEHSQLPLFFACSVFQSGVDTPRILQPLSLSPKPGRTGSLSTL